MSVYYLTSYIIQFYPSKQINLLFIMVLIILLILKLFTPAWLEKLILPYNKTHWLTFFVKLFHYFCHIFGEAQRRQRVFIALLMGHSLGLMRETSS